MKKNLASLKKFAGLFGVYICSIFFTTTLNASQYSWECKKNRSYLIEEREIVDESVKKIPTKFLSNLDEKSKVISVNYDLEKGIASINGNSAIVSGTSKSNRSLERIPYQSLVISSYRSSIDDAVTQTTEVAEYGKKTFEKRQLSTIIDDSNNYFVLNTQINTANFVSTELKEFSVNQFIFEDDDDVHSRETLDIKEFIEISTGECRLL